MSAMVAGVFCNRRSVTTNYVDSQYAVLNGAPTFMTLVERARRPHERRMELPPSWKRAITGLDDARDRKPHHFRPTTSATEGRRSFDDVMRLAYKQYGGERGFTPDEFRAVAEEIAAVDLKGWFKRSVSSVEELDYTDLLEWFGLRFTTGEGAAANSRIEVREDATDAQRRNLKAWLTGR